MKLENKIMLDFVMLLILILLQLIMVTGNVAHELLGIAFVVLALIHCMVNRGTIKSCCRKNTSWKTKVRLFVDVILVVLLLMLMLSGVMISVFIFRPFNIAYHGIWFTVHVWSSKVFIIAIAIHLLINIKKIAVAFREKQQSKA